MRITSKGQVTIPAPLRERAGTEVEFELDGDAVRIVRSRTRKGETRGERLVRLLLGNGSGEMTTDEIMALTRGD
jgi:AbrB family looped-hinge helix DNA binding protein